MVFLYEVFIRETSQIYCENSILSTNEIDTHYIPK